MKSYQAEVLEVNSSAWTPERIEVARRPFRGDLLEALMVDLMGKEQRVPVPWVIDDGLL